MTAQCCQGERPPRGLARRLPGAAASLAPGAALVLLPKCPLCLAAWLTVATGIGVSATAAAYMERVLAVLAVTTAALRVVQIVRRRGFRRSGAV